MKIVFLDYSTLGGANIDGFKRFGDVVVYDTTEQKDVNDRIKDADVVVINKIIMSQKVIQNAANLKLILISATGTNNIDFDAAKKHNVSVKNVAGYSTDGVVQHTFALLFSLMNKTTFYDKWVKNKNWCKSDIFCDFTQRIDSLSGKNFGVIGLGSIGSKVAKIAQMFGANVFYVSLSGKNNNTEFKKITLNQLLQTCDIISIHSPFNKFSENLISMKELKLVKNGAYILNLGRGGIIDEAALSWAIDNKNIKAGLDVLKDEPINTNNLLLKVKNTNNIIITPHIAWSDKDSINRLVDMMLQNLQNWINEC